MVNHKKVYYSKSTDSGNTWTQAILISEESISVAVYPIIRCDSQNNLFVAYSYGSGNEDSRVHIRKFDGTAWSQIFNVGESLNPVSVIDMVVDNNDLLYIFIYYGGTYGYSLYRSWNGSVWSDLVVLYDGESYNNSICNVKCDMNNNLHCLSIYRPNGQTYYANRAAYCCFDSSINEWNSPLVLSTAYTPSSSCLGDINLDINQNPSITWRQDENYGTGYYSFFEDSFWQGPFELVDSLYDVRHTIDSLNSRHWIGVKRDFTAPYTWTYNLVYICEPAITLTTITDFAYGTFYPRLLRNNNESYLIFSGSDVSGQPEVYILKKDLTPSSSEDDVIEETPGISEIALYPNPAKHFVTIEFLSKENMPLVVDVFNLRGQRVSEVHSGPLDKGKHQMTWDTRDSNGGRTANGIYMLRFRSASNQYFRKFILLR